MDITNEQLREMARGALENWDFSQQECGEDDLDCQDENERTMDIQIGLRGLAAPGDFDQEIIDERFAGANEDTKWDVLEEWAVYMAS
jgi:hypothetical protein